MRIIILLYAAIFMAEVANSEEEKQVELLPEYFEVRRDVLANLPASIPMQLTLPSSYPICLFSAYEQSMRKNNEAHTTLLNQIDFLASQAVSRESIIALVSYGHSLGNADFSRQCDTLN